MADKQGRTKQIGMLLTPERHKAFKIACAQMGTTMAQLLDDAVSEAIVRASLQPGARQEVSGNG